MKKVAVILVGLLGVLLLGALVFGLWAMGINNSMIGKSENVGKQWAQVENAYQRRADLVPNLVATVQGAANFEKSTLTEVTEARASVGRTQINADSISDPAALLRFQQAQDQLSSALSRLMVVVEKYPELKATQSFLTLQSQLEGTENRISVERGKFNDAVRDYNVHIQKFPNFIIAGLRGYKSRPYFEATPGSNVPPVVKFDGPSGQPASK